MAAASQFKFTRKELTTLMIKDAGVHEGLWILDAEFKTKASNFGPPDDLAIGVTLTVHNIGIHLVSPDNNLPVSMVVDAAVVNPDESARDQVNGRKRSVRGLN